MPETNDDGYAPHTGLLPDPPDDRDFAFRDIVAAGAADVVTDEEVARGFSAYEELGIKPGLRDQGGRSSCTCEAAAEYVRVLRVRAGLADQQFAATSAYPFIVLPGGGAYLRDAAKAMADGRFVPKSVLPDEDSRGNPLPESIGTDKLRVTAAVQEIGRMNDIFGTYRSLKGGTDDIRMFMTAIREGYGAILGFTGTNEGWCSCGRIRPPKAGEPKWGHAVFSGEFGLADVAECGLAVGEEAVFVPGSWGGRYTIKTGRWAGRSAITAEYFRASQQVAGAGEVKGIYVSPSWTVIPVAAVPDEVFKKDFTRRHERKLGRVPETGTRFLVLGPTADRPNGRVYEISREAAGFAALACVDYGIGQDRRVETPLADYNKLSPEQFPG